jgi:nucleotide-binding universal stress UspA family protein
VVSALPGALHIVRVVTLPAMTEDSGYVVDRLTDDAWQYIEGIEATLDLKIASMEVLIGDPASEIRDYAAAIKADTVVLSTRGSGGAGHHSIGSVTDRLLTSPCSLLIVR